MTDRPPGGSDPTQPSIPAPPLPVSSDMRQMRKELDEHSTRLTGGDNKSDYGLRGDARAVSKLVAELTVRANAHGQRSNELKDALVRELEDRKLANEALAALILSARGPVLAVYGSALHLEAQAKAREIEEQTGVPVHVLQLHSRKRPSVGQYLRGAARHGVRGVYDAPNDPFRHRHVGPRLWSCDAKKSARSHRRSGSVPKIVRQVTSVDGRLCATTHPPIAFQYVQLWRLRPHARSSPRLPARD